MLHVEKEKKKREEYLQELMASDSFKDLNEAGGDRREGHDVNIFSFGSIAASTNDFSDENKLGQGGFGPVYKVFKLQLPFYVFHSLVPRRHRFSPFSMSNNDTLLESRVN